MRGRAGIAAGGSLPHADAAVDVVAFLGSGLRRFRGGDFVFPAAALDGAYGVPAQACLLARLNVAGVRAGWTTTGSSVHKRQHTRRRRGRRWTWPYSPDHSWLRRTDRRGLRLRANFTSRQTTPRKTVRLRRKLKGSTASPRKKVKSNFRKQQTCKLFNFGKDGFSYGGGCVFMHVCSKCGMEGHKASACKPSSPARAP